MNDHKIRTELTDVPETMLWTIHNRATEAMRDDRILDDPEAIRIYEGINYDYERSFGKADASHAMRSLMFDEGVRAFLAQYPNGVVVNLGEGLETQRFRIQSEQALWFSVDLPDSIAMRERFIQPDDQHRHIPLSFLDEAWFEYIPNDRPVFITAQGLLMYFPENEVRRFLQRLSQQFPCAWMMFDTIPVWFSKRTMKGLALTASYTAPPMPWGINISDVEQTLRVWVPALAEIRNISMPAYPRGMKRLVYFILTHLPVVRHWSPTAVYIRFGA